jgi:hypothetical protein
MEVSASNPKIHILPWLYGDRMHQFDVDPYNIDLTISMLANSALTIKLLYLDVSTPYPPAVQIWNETE